jgi:hypothetical protein
MTATGRARAPRAVAYVAALFVASQLAGCATVGPPAGPYGTGPIGAHLLRDDDVGDCARHLQAIDAKVDQRGVRDATAPRVPGFPYLRVDRLTASLAPRTTGAAPAAAPVRAAWLARLNALDREARLVEFSNGELHAAEWSALERCRPQLQAADFGDAAPLAAERQRFADLLAAATVPDDYSDGQRALGLYPLTRHAFAAGIRKWQERTRATFALPVERLPTHGVRVRYRPVPAEDTATLAGLPATPLAREHGDGSPAAIDALGIPRLTRAQGWELLARHAPLLDIDTATVDDRLGRMTWRSDTGVPMPAADTALPAAYARIAFARLGAKVRVQLVYTFWFPARPAQHAADALAGALDAIVWRVTLDDRGAPAGADAERFVPLAYDSIHACGCYHLFFPTARVRERPQPESIDEGLFAPRAIDAPRAGERLVLHVASRTHYLQQIGIDVETAAAASGAPALRYALRDEDELRVLPLPRGGTRSIYDERGLVPGTERPERFFFWPMGIESAGQMRQWGRHATAFVGRRHFDDPDLLERYFEVVGR